MSKKKKQSDTSKVGSTEQRLKTDLKEEIRQALIKKAKVKITPAIKSALEKADPKKLKKWLRMIKEENDLVKEDSKFIVSLADYFEKILENLALRAINGEDVTDGIDYLEEKFDSFRFIRAIIYFDEDQLQRYMDQADISKEEKSRLYSWRKKYSILSDSFDKSDNKRRNIENHWTKYEDNCTYDDKTEYPQIELSLFSFNKKILYMKDDADDLFALAKAFAQMYFRSLEYCDKNTDKISAKFIERSQRIGKELKKILASIDKSLKRLMNSTKK